MKLLPGGIDVWYVDESTDCDIFAMTAVSVPFLRLVEGTWTVVWDDQFANMREWRRELRRQHHIPTRKELKASKLVGGRGRYLRGEHQLRPADAVAAYRWALSNLGFLQPSSIISVAAHRATNLYGHSRLQAALIVLLQRMRTATARAELGLLSAAHTTLGVDTLYDAIPAPVLNLKAAASKDSARGIVRV